MTQALRGGIVSPPSKNNLKNGFPLEADPQTRFLTHNNISTELTVGLLTYLFSGISWKLAVNSVFECV